MSNESLADIDLNFPLVEETTTSTNRQGGSFDLPIVVEESNNDVQVLSSLESSNQRRDQSSRNHQVAAELGATVEPPLGQSDLSLVSNQVETMSNESLGDIDLNFPLVEETSTSTNRQGGSFDLPIVVEESNNDVQVSSSLESSNQRRDQSSRNHQVAAELGATVEPPLGQSGDGAEEHVSTLLSLGVSAEEHMSTLLSLSIASNQERTSAYSNNTNRELNLASGVPEGENASLKKPTFSCPMCLNSLTNPVSTNCGHIFCQSCIEAALSHKKVCPICRTKLPSKKKFHPVYLPDAD